MADLTRNLPALLAAADAAEGEPELLALVERASPAEQAALARALRGAYDAGEQAAEARTGRFVASVLQPMLGLPDLRELREQSDPRRVVRGALRILGGLAGRS